MLFNCNQRCASLLLMALLALSPAGFVGAASGAAISSSAEEKLQRYLEAVNSKIHPKAQEAIPQIDGLNRRLVAIRGYLRYGFLRFRMDFTVYGFQIALQFYFRRT